MFRFTDKTSYYPFGMMMPGRKYSIANTNYRYGFNGKENDKEVKGEGNQQDYGMRIYDPRLGRFLSEDPITKEYPELTPYQFASNNPIWNIDLDGLEGVPYPYTDPRQMLYEAGSNISEAMANLVDKFSTKVEFGYTFFKNLFVKDNASVSLEHKTTFSAGLSSNASNFLSYVKNKNSSEGAPEPFNLSFAITPTISIVTKEDLGLVSLTNTMSIDSKGISRDKFTGTFSSTFAGIPADFSMSNSKSSAKENTFSLGFSLKPPNPLKMPFSLKMPSSLDYTQSESGNKKVEIKSGTEIKIGEKSGIKLFGNADFGISF